MELLKTYDLWDIQPDSEIPPIVLASFPVNFEELEVNNKKRAFFHSLLPVAMIALSEIESERATVEYILNKLQSAGVGGKIDFSDNGDWTVILDSVELDFLRHLTAKYRTSDSQVLLKRVNVIPISLIMAQGAIESSWGSSRFALEGNNLFGIWTWGKNGIVPALREEGLNHKIAIYPSILESVRDYILVLNRHQAYSKFRDLRNQSFDPITLVDGLIKYSERREDYIRDVKRMIRSNELQRFDSYLLTSQLDDPDGLMNMMFLRKNLNVVI
ncbi:MAG: glucosaminidase domain-containing protein [Proteobacteria bacterium]|nr:glucosaminidase domain-containing protein [Pseudomonadota bacterium]MBU1708535.1 glucosaminidase domain-containing protein [Pseudomonadota bacterium]